MKLPTSTRELSHVIPVRSVTSAPLHADYLPADGDIYVVLPGADTKTIMASYFYDTSATVWKSANSGEWPILTDLSVNTGLRTVCKFCDLVYTGNTFKTVGWLEIYPVSDPNLASMFGGATTNSEYWAALQRVPGYRRISMRDLPSRLHLTHTITNGVRNQIFRKFDEGPTTTATDPEPCWTTIVIRLHGDDTGADYTAQALLEFLTFEAHTSVESMSSDAAYLHLQTPSPPVHPNVVHHYASSLSNTEHTVAR